MVDPKTAKILHEQLPQITTDLLRYAKSKIREGFWLSGRLDLPDGNRVEDIVSESIEDVIVGTITWDRKKDLLPFLMDVIDSKVNHLIQSPRHTKRVFAVEVEGKTVNPIELSVDSSPDPLSDAFVNHLICALQKILPDDYLGVLILDCFKEHIFKREDIVYSLNISFQDYDKAIKRIRRAAETFDELQRKKDHNP